MRGVPPHFVEYRERRQMLNFIMANNDISYGYYLLHFLASMATISQWNDHPIHLLDLARLTMKHMVLHKTTPTFTYTGPHWQVYTY
jgi:peptidoglycan/LPS O-acetylase OafA/YrhL